MQRGRSRPGRGPVVLSAVVSVGLLLAGCGPGNGTISGRVPLHGVGGSGQVLTVVAIHAGRVVTQAKVRPGGHFTLSVPPGTYQVGISTPGLSGSLEAIECPGQASVRGGQSITVDLVCLYAARLCPPQPQRMDKGHFKSERGLVPVSGHRTHAPTCNYQSVVVGADTWRWRPTFDVISEGSATRRLRSPFRASGQ